MADLRRYVPGAALSWPGEDASRPVPLHRHVDGTLVFVDVSGFTALSEKLAQRGKVGAEQLTDVLNTVFGTMLGLAAARGGTLLKFGGDALFLLFTGEGHAVQASCAAVEMRTALAETSKTPSPAGRLRLRMSVGVHTGLVDLFLVGTSHRELVVVGPATTAVAELEGSASAGQILLGEQTAASLPPSAVGDPIGSGRLLRWRSPHADHPTGYRRPDTDVDVGRFVPTALRSFLASGDPESEHRTVGVSFVRYNGMDALLEEQGHQDAADALHMMVTSAQGCCDAEGVTFLATDLAEDGGKIILVAGFPTTAEDDQSRLLRASRRIVTDSLAQKWPLAVRAGLNRGHVFAGAIGSFERATVTVMGDTVNLAARVMAKADPGTVLTTTATLDNAQTLFATEPVEPFMVKGKSRPVTAYQVGEETGTRPPRGLGSLPFLGRDEELATILEAVDALRDGSGHVITVTGEVGIGKTRLLREALSARDTVPKVRARAEPYGAATPYRPLRDPLRHLLGLDHSVSGELSTWLSETVPLLVPDLAPWLPLIGDVLAIPVDETQATRDLDPQFRPDRTADALVRLLETLAGGPMVVVLDDAHYADDATATLLARIEREAASRPWLLLTSRRAEEGGFRAARERAIELGPLDDGAVRRLVHEGTAAAPLRPHEVDAVISRVAGNPLFIEETLANLRRHSDLDALPSSLEGMVAAQIDGLAPLARRIIRRASVLGRSFRVGVLNDLFAHEGISLDDSTMQELADFLEPDGKGRLRFRHALIRDSAYDSLPFRRRQEIHGLAAESILRRARGRPEEYADNLSLHFFMSGNDALAWRWARTAGDQARDAYAQPSAVTHYQRAARVAQRLPDVTSEDLYSVYEELGHALEREGVFERALVAYGDAYRYATTPALRGRMRLRRARVRAKRGQYRAELAELSRARRELETDQSAEAAGVLAEVAAERSVAYIIQGRYRAAIAEAEDAMAGGRSAGAQKAVALGLERKEIASQMLGRSTNGRDFRQALAIYEELGDLDGQSRVANNLGTQAFFSGDWGLAQENYKKAADQSRRLGNHVDAAISDSNLGEILVLQNRYAEAEELLDGTSRVLRAAGDVDSAIHSDILLARVWLGLGRLEKARAVLDQITPEVESAGGVEGMYEAAIVQAELSLAEGSPTAALEVLQSVQATAVGEPRVLVPRFALVRARALVQGGRTTEGMQAALRGLDEARRQAFEYDEAMLVLMMDGHQHDGGDAARAQEVLQRLGVDSV